MTPGPGRSLASPETTEVAVDVMDRAFAAVYERAAPTAERRRLAAERRPLLADTSGHVVDVGAGLGANLPHLGPGVERCTLLEPAPHMARRLRARLVATSTPFPWEVVEAPGEAMPLPSSSVDVVLCTLVLCTVPDLPLTLREARRVLRPGGRLVLLEHVRADGPLAHLQDALRPAWSFVARGCDPSRDIRAAVDAAGFDTSEVRAHRLRGFGPASPAIAGTARLPAG